MQYWWILHRHWKYAGHVHWSQRIIQYLAVFLKKVLNIGLIWQIGAEMPTGIGESQMFSMCLPCRACRANTIVRHFNSLTCTLLFEVCLNAFLTTTEYKFDRGNGEVEQKFYVFYVPKLSFIDNLLPDSRAWYCIYSLFPAYVRQLTIL